MEVNKISKSDDQLVDKLLQEAYSIINNSQDLNNDREKLINILNQFVYWTNEKNHLEDYFNEFQKIICSMATLDFSNRLPLNPCLKTFQNLVSVSLNTLNEELDDKVFPKDLVKLSIDKLELKNTIIIQADKGGYIKMFHTDMKTMYPNSEFFEGSVIGAFIDNMDQIEEEIVSAGTNQAFKVKLKFGYNGEAILKVATNRFYKISEGTVFIIQIPNF